MPNALEEFENRQIESRGYDFECVETGIGLPALEATEVRLVKAATLSKLYLT